jgi:hypothetical protein
LCLNADFLVDVILHDFVVLEPLRIFVGVARHRLLLHLE